MGLRTSLSSSVENCEQPHAWLNELGELERVARPWGLTLELFKVQTPDSGLFLMPQMIKRSCFKVSKPMGINTACFRSQASSKYF